jgi:hypothetical protein
VIRAGRTRIVFAACIAAGSAAGAFHWVEDWTSASDAASSKVLVRTTGDDSELAKTVPITRRSRAERRVVMSMGPRRLPALTTGDRLEVTAELQVTVDCFRQRPACVGRPYLHNPHVGARLVLARRSDATGGEHAIPLSEREVITCHAKPLSSRQHHCVLVFTDAALNVEHARSLPCARPSCHVNFVLDAHSRSARRGEKLIVGANKPDGRILQDKGRINAVRLRPANQPPPRVLETRKRRNARVPLDQTPTVVLSKRLRELRKNTQLSVLARMRTDVSRLPYSARVTTHLILARRRHSTATSDRVARLASLHGEIAETNGSNCTLRQTPCPYPKVGVMRMRRNATNQAGHRIPLYINLYVVSNPKRNPEPSGRQLRILPRARLKVTRYRPALRG